MDEQLDLFASSAPRPGGEIWTASGPRQAEEALLVEVGRWLAATRRDPAALGQPLRIVVPSRSLRLHLGAALAARHGGAAGVVVQTLHGLAAEIAERAGSPVPGGDVLFDVVVARLARQQAALRDGLDWLVDGYRHVAATVRDLLDAGFEPVHREALDELLATEGPRVASRAQLARARAVVAVATRTEEALGRLGAARGPTVLRRAAALLAATPELLPARALFIHGFADVTGLAADLLEELLRCGARLIVDWPSRPDRIAAGIAADAAAPGETAFTARLLRRFAVFPRRSVGAVPPIAPPPDQFHAIGPDGEVREVARRIRALLSAGARPEGIAIVGRDLERYRLPLRRHLRRFGVPFSGVGERGPLSPAARLSGAFVDLLRQRDRIPTDRFLELVGVLGPGLRMDLRLGFLSLGAGRLRDVAALVPARLAGGLDLPVRLGLVPNNEATGDTADAARALEEEAELRGGHAPARRVSGTRLAAAIAVAVAVCERLASWPNEAPLAVHRTLLRRLLGADLGWRAQSRAEPLRTALLGLGEQLRPDLSFRFDELELLLERMLADSTLSALGGAGGGVQVLTATEARGRCFECLFVIGLNRDLFPRLVREDALLGDALRQRLGALLPELPLKSGVFDEDRYLFAQLLAAAPAVTLSWRRADEDGKPQPVSPLLVRVGGRDLAVAAAPLLRPAPGSPVPADEAATIAALTWGRRAAEPALVRAVAAVRTGLVQGSWSPPAGPLAGARLRILDEMEPDLKTEAGSRIERELGPYFGFIGRLAGAADGDPRLRPLYVTQLEGLARCPWRLFLGRLLRVEPTPDPLAALPGLDNQILGQLVHGALEKILEQAAQGVVGWPDDAALAALLQPLAVELLAAQGSELPGLVRALVNRALPYLAVVRGEDLDEGAQLALAESEVHGEVLVARERGAPRRLHFIADRLEPGGSAPLWTDYKVGRPPSPHKRPEGRWQEFVRQVRKGFLLQAVAYQQSGDGGVGRYVYLRPDLEPTLRVVAVDTSARDAIAAFKAAVASSLAAWEAGSFFPRLVGTDLRTEPQLCRFCEVAEACVRGDSGARRRLSGWVEHGLSSESQLATLGSDAERAVLGMWSDSTAAPVVSATPEDRES